MYIKIDKKDTNLEIDVNLSFDSFLGSKIC